MAGTQDLGLQAVPQEELALLSAAQDPDALDIEEGQAVPAATSASLRGRKKVLIGVLGVLGVAACACAHQSQGLRLGLAGLVSLHSVYATYDPLSTSVAGAPGMPMGIDNDDIRSIGAPMPSSGSLAGALACTESEEEYLGLCYRKCSLLTNSTFPKRVAANGCCKELSVKCLMGSEVKFEGLFPGSGFNVNGDMHAPHNPGICDGNEELHAGLCYKKCYLLTTSEFPMRSGAATCCKKQPCWNPFNTKTEGGVCDGFSVGGGMTDGHNCPHSPTLSQTSK